MELREFADRLDDRLDTDAYADVDVSANGLQVGPSADTGSAAVGAVGDAASSGTGTNSPEAGTTTERFDVEHAAFAVDAATATIAEGADVGADVLVAHHGISWGGIEHVTGRTYERIASLVDGDLALYVSHLPLDGHTELGNAAGVADAIGLSDREPFGTIGPVTIGTIGRTHEPLPADAIRDRLDRFDGNEAGTRTLDFGPDRIERVAVVTGSGADWLDEAAAAGADALITGEGKQQVYHDAREAGMTVFLAGHYATETFGVRSLRSLAEEWGLETTYLSHPTGL